MSLTYQPMTLKIQPEDIAKTALFLASDDARAIDDLIAEALAGSNSDAPAPEAPQQPQTPPITFDPHQRLRELKKKLVAGPEKRYYELTELGIGKLQIGILLNLVIVLLCAGVTTLLALDMVPENRMRLVIFSQVLAMLVSGLLGSHLMLDGLGSIFKGRFNLNSLLTFTFIACCVDAASCLVELRVPCCAAFCLEMTMAMAARCQRRSTEMGQMDTLRKAVRLKGITSTSERPGYRASRWSLMRRSLVTNRMGLPVWRHRSKIGRQATHFIAASITIRGAPFSSAAGIWSGSLHNLASNFSFA